MFTRLIALLQLPRPSEPINPQVIELARSKLLQENTANLPGATHVVTSTALLTLETLVGAVKGCPILPLQAASSVIFLLLQTFETARSNNDDLVRIANDACEIIVMIIRSYQDEGTEEWKSSSDMTANQKEALTRFVDKTYLIYKNADKLSKRPFFIKFVSARVDVGAIKAAREALDHARFVFDLVLQISIRQDIAMLLQSVNQIKLQRSEATPNPPQVNEATPPSTVDLPYTTISPRLIEPPQLTSARFTGRPISTPVLPDEPLPTSAAGSFSAGPPRTTNRPPPVAVSQVLPPALGETTSTAASPSAASPSQNPDHQSPLMDPTPPETYYGAPGQSHVGPMFSQYSTPNQLPPMGHTPPWSYNNPPVATSITSPGSSNISAGRDNKIGTYGGFHQTNHNSGNTYNGAVVGSFNDNIWKFFETRCTSHL